MSSENIESNRNFIFGLQVGESVEGYCLAVRVDLPKQNPIRPNVCFVRIVALESIFNLCIHSSLIVSHNFKKIIFWLISQKIKVVFFSWTSNTHLFSRDSQVVHKLRNYTEVLMGFWRRWKFQERATSQVHCRACSFEILFLAEKVRSQRSLVQGVSLADNSVQPNRDGLSRKQAKCIPLWKKRFFTLLVFLSQNSYIMLEIFIVSNSPW